MLIFISSMIHSEWYEIDDLICRGFGENAYKPLENRKPEKEEFAIFINILAEKGLLSADEVVLIAGSDARIEASYE